MDQKRTKNSAKKRNRRFVWLSVIISTIVMAGLMVLCFRYLKNRAAIRLDRAERYLTAENYEGAETVLKNLQSSGLTLTDEESERLTELLHESVYGEAEKKLAAGDTDGAETLFTSLGTYSDAQDRVKECKYRAAEALEAAGDYTAAASAFRAIAGYSDAMTRYDECRYQLAVETEAAGDQSGALSIFLELGSYSDAEEQAGRLATEITGVADTDTALDLAQGYTEDQMTEMSSLANTRAEFKDGLIAVGFYHTVGLQADGRVVAAGRNDEGECEVSSWTDITAVDAGAYHTVGLRSDGTVVAVGRNDEGQCEVSSWTDITAIACTDYGTIGLKSDGTVVTCGYNVFSALTGWQDVTAVGAGSYMAAAIRSGGTLLCSHPTGSDEEAAAAFTELVAVDCSTGYVLGLKRDGSVVSTAGDTGWTNCVKIAAGSNGYMAITQDGKLYAHYFEDRNAIDFSDVPENGLTVKAIAMGGTHAAVLLSDGSVVTRGTNDYGECDTAEWNLG